MVSFPIDNGGKENHGKRKKYGRQDPMGTNAKEAFPLYPSERFPLSEALWAEGILDPPSRAV